MARIAAAWMDTREGSSGNERAYARAIPMMKAAEPRTHSGNFAQGQIGVTYTITVSNARFAPTSGTVPVTDSLPTGLMATDISGTGWICVLGTLTCTRGDSLAAFVGYPAITKSPLGLASSSFW